MEGWTLQVEGEKRNRRGRLPKFERTTPFTSRFSFISRGGVICGKPEILVTGILIERELGIR
jgi:hypothetical protein